MSDRVCGTTSGHVFGPDVDDPGPKYVVACQCGAVTMTAEEMGDGLATLAFSHPQNGEPYHLARLTIET